MDIGLLPSSPTLRQRLDAKAQAMFDLVPPMIETLPGGSKFSYHIGGRRGGHRPRPAASWPTPGR